MSYSYMKKIKTTKSKNSTITSSSSKCSYLKLLLDSEELEYNHEAKKFQNKSELNEENKIGIAYSFTFRLY
ncbi:hypothetical protein H8356DRAFT_1348941 [Neocallimastix lanati (nom. inval.)]|nr:hypothetical protein H8356DRAFT_1348941 [Neocallimastix sp. JGI-2020a]